MNWATIIAIALSIWGFVPNFTITYDEVQQQPADYGNLYVLAYSSETLPAVGANPIACNISYVMPHLAGASQKTLQNVTTHEVGHCLGLDHIVQAGVMAPSITDATMFTGYDRAEFWRHHPSPYRAVLPGLAE